MILIAHAAVSAEVAAQCLVHKVNQVILFPLIGLLMAVAFLIFLWGAFEYVKNSDNEAGRAQGRNHLLYGTIGMLVMLSAWAILNIAAGTFGLGGVLSNSRELEGVDPCSYVGTGGEGGTPVTGDDSFGGTPTTGDDSKGGTPTADDPSKGGWPVTNEPR